MNLLAAKSSTLVGVGRSDIMTDSESEDSEEVGGREPVLGAVFGFFGRIICGLVIDATPFFHSGLLEHEGADGVFDGADG